MFFPQIPSCGAHKQFGAEPVQYGLEINFKELKNQTLANHQISMLQNIAL